jgi:Family of unknown function (DUF6644)
LTSWLPVFQSIELSFIGQAIKTSPWAFPVIEAVHLLAFAALGGSILLVDLRAFGVGLRSQSVANLAREAQPVLFVSLGAMLATGVLMFVSEAVKCYHSAAFQLKMTSLLLAMLFTFTVRRKVTMMDEGSVGPLVLKLVAIVSLALWFGVAASGRWIGWSG